MTIYIHPNVSTTTHIKSQSTAPAVEETRLAMFARCNTIKFLGFDEEGCFHSTAITDYSHCYIAVRYTCQCAPYRETPSNEILWLLLGLSKIVSACLSTQT
jgi:hypothetical protein